MEPAKSIFEINLTIYCPYLFTKFGENWIEIATSSVDTHTNTYIHTHTENLSRREIGGEISLPVLWDFLFRHGSQKLV